MMSCPHPGHQIWGMNRVRTQLRTSALGMSGHLLDLTGNLGRLEKLAVHKVQGQNFASAAEQALHLEDHLTAVELGDDDRPRSKGHFGQFRIRKGPKRYRAKESDGNPPPARVPNGAQSGAVDGAEKMEDVIFNGTESRKALNVVSIII